MTDQQLIAWLEAQTWSNWAKDVARKARLFGLTEGQRTAARSMYHKISIREILRKSSGSLPLEVGFYHRDGDWYRVKLNRTKTKRYILKFQPDRQRWAFEGWSVRGLTAGHRVSEEQASVFGHQFGQCLVCSRTLTDPVSVARGIGPVCAGRLTP